MSNGDLIAIPDFAIREYKLRKTELLIFSSIYTYEVETTSTATTKDEYAALCGVTIRRIDQALNSLLHKGLIVLIARVVDNKIVTSYALSDIVREKVVNEACKK